MTAPTCNIKLTVNGETVDETVEARKSLVDFLREELTLTGSHVGCEHGFCGACTVRVNGVIVLTPRVTAQSLSAAQDLLAVGRFGVGYDSVDVSACTLADVLLFITAGAVDRSVAEATVGWMLALTHQIRSKDRLVREPMSGFAGFLERCG